VRRHWLDSWRIGLRSTEQNKCRPTLYRSQWLYTPSQKNNYIGRSLGRELCIVENYLFTSYMSVIQCKIPFIMPYNLINKKNVTLQIGYTSLSLSPVHRSSTLSPVYTIQPVVKPTTGLTNGCIVYTAGCQTSCTTRFDNRLNEQWLFVQHGCQTSCQTRLTTGWMFVYTIQPVVQVVVQTVVLCKRGFTEMAACMKHAHCWPASCFQYLQMRVCSFVYARRCTRATHPSGRRYALRMANMASTYSSWTIW